MIDLRSDTVTKPSPGMLRAMMSSGVGDDVFGEDPTVNALQERVAALLGKESALFVPSGTMGNELCIKTHTEHGDEIIVERESHIFIYETAGPSLLAGVQMQPVAGVRGAIPASAIKEAIRPRTYYMPPTRLICLENTHGRSAGSVVPVEAIAAIHAVALEAKIPMHLDGARLWNACAASGRRPEEFARWFDSVSVCFSKGLGAPIGSMIAGSAPFIERARRFRKIFGGGMRQAGLLAGAALYALDNNVERLAEDHAKARLLAEEISALRSFTVDMEQVQTNMVFADTAPSGKSRDEVLRLLQSEGVLLTPESASSIRAVTHLDVSIDEVRRAAQVFRKLFR